MASVKTINQTPFMSRFDSITQKFDALKTDIPDFLVVDAMKAYAAILPKLFEVSGLTRFIELERACAKHLMAIDHIVDGKGAEIIQKLEAGERDARAALGAANLVILLIQGAAEELIEEFEDEACSAEERIQDAAEAFAENIEKMKPQLKEACDQLDKAAASMNTVRGQIDFIKGKIEAHVTKAEADAASSAKTARGWTYGLCALFPLSYAISVPICETCIHTMFKDLKKMIEQMDSQLSEFEEISAKAKSVAQALNTKKDDLIKIKAQMIQTQTKVEKVAKETNERKIQKWMRRSITSAQELVDLCKASLESVEIKA